MDDIKDILATVRDDVETVRKAGTWNARIKSIEVA